MDNQQLSSHPTDPSDTATPGRQRRNSPTFGKDEFNRFEDKVSTSPKEEGPDGLRKK